MLEFNNKAQEANSIKQNTPYYLNKRYHAGTDSHIIHIMLDFNDNAQADT
jgi:hypothetical protein